MKGSQLKLRTVGFVVATTIGFLYLETLYYQTPAKNRQTPWSPKVNRDLEPRVYELFDQTATSVSPHESSYELSGLRQRCAETKFDSEVYLQCAGILAGLTSVMSQVKTCVKMAADLGYNVVLPVMALRDSKDLTNFNMLNGDAHMPYGDWFDEDHFVTTLESTCPHMKVARLKADKTPDIEVARMYDFPVGWFPYYGGMGKYAWSSNQWRDFMRQNVTGGIQALKEAETPVKSGSTIVLTTARMLFFDITLDTSGVDLKVWNDLNFLMRYKEPVRTIILKLLAIMQTQQSRFYGIHYRAEADIPQEWNDLIGTERGAELLKMAEEAWKKYDAATTTTNPNAIKLAYIACGNAAQIDVFRNQAAQKGWNLVDKYSLSRSDPALRNQIDALPFDHQGMIDLAILSISDFFIGATNSAFSWTLAHNRHPSGRYQGSSVVGTVDEGRRISATHLFFDGESDYPCCL